MGRVHLFEFGDQPWFPDVLHQAMTDFLAFAANTVSMPYLGSVTVLRCVDASSTRRPRGRDGGPR